MANHATKAALNTRAKDAANWMDEWARSLLKEMKAQNVEMLLLTSTEGGGVTENEDDDLTIVLKRRQLRALVRGLQYHNKEILKYATLFR